MEGCVFLSILGGFSGVAGGLVCGGFWEAFCLVMARAEPTSNQIVGLALGGGCLGIVMFLGAALAVVIAEEISSSRESARIMRHRSASGET